MKALYLNSLSVIIIACTLIIGCKKEGLNFVQYESTNFDQLTGDTAIFFGTWVWVYTDHYYGWCENESYYEHIDSSTEATQFKIQFFQSGYIYYFRNDTLISEYRISFQYFDFNSQAPCSLFSIDLDGFDDLNLSGCVSNDTLQCHVPGFIFYPEAGCENYVNIFVKE